MGALHAVLAKSEVAGTDVVGFASFVFGVLAVVLTYVRVTRERTRRILLAVFVVCLLEAIGLLASVPLWIRILAGAIALTVGIAIVLIRSRGEGAVDDAHAERLRQLLDAARTAVKNDDICQFPDTDARIFTSHFPQLDKQLTDWNRKADAYRAAKRALRQTVESKLLGLHADGPEYKSDTLIDGLCTITETRARENRGADTLPPIVGPEADQPIFTYAPMPNPRLMFTKTSGSGIVLTLDNKTAPADPYDAIMKKIQPIYELLRTLQSNEPRVLEWRLSALDKPRSSLERDIETTRKTEYYKPAKECPDCVGPAKS